jgi:hypothetical protein
MQSLRMVVVEEDEREELAAILAADRPAGLFFSLRPKQGGGGIHATGICLWIIPLRDTSSFSLITSFCRPPVPFCIW